MSGHTEDSVEVEEDEEVIDIELPIQINKPKQLNVEYYEDNVDYSTFEVNLHYSD